MSRGEFELVEFTRLTVYAISRLLFLTVLPGTKRSPALWTLDRLKLEENQLNSSFALFSSIGLLTCF
jgi:hypothetical protein